MAFEFLDNFLGDALDFGEDLFDFGKDFASDLSIEDVASLTTTGVAVSQLFGGPEGSTSDALARVKTSGDALKAGAAITSTTGDVPELELGADTERTKTGRAVTANRLRVRRSFDPGAGLSANPLSIQI
jgi:hypothetical protein